jgi:tetratricopeptide (TPR) repeat protein
LRQPLRHLLTAASAAALLAGCGGGEGSRPLGEAAPLAVTLGSSGQGADQLRAGELSSARSSFESALSADPERLEALNDLGVSYLLEGHVEAARRLLDEVVAKGNPREQQDALLNLGELYALQGYLEAADAYLETANAVDKARPEPFYALALLHDARGDAVAGQSALSMAVRLDEDGTARMGFAFAYSEERVHLEAMLAEQAGDRAAATMRWRELSQGRFAPLSSAAERHLSSD